MPSFKKEHDVSTCWTKVVSHKPHLEQCSFAGNFCGQSFALIGFGLLFLLRFELDLVAKSVKAGRVIIRVRVLIIGVVRVRVVV